MKSEKRTREVVKKEKSTNRLNMIHKLSGIVVSMTIIFTFLGKICLDSFYKPKIVSVDQSEMTLAKIDLSPNRTYRSKKKNSSETAYDHLVENAIWVENKGDKALRITEGSVLKINKVKELKEVEKPLSIVIGVKESRLIVYVVNNTCNVFSDLTFNFESLINTFAQEPAEAPLTMDEMSAIFNTENFKRSVDTISAGEVFKVFEFDLSEKIKFYQSKHHFEVTVIGKKNRHKKFDHPFQRIYLFYKEDQGFDYEYFTQGSGVQERPYASMPKIFVDVENIAKQDTYPINLNTKINAKDTLALTQYIIPNKSCIISYSIELMTNGKLIKDKKLSNLEAQIFVPIYSLDQKPLSKNEAFFKALCENNVRSLNYKNSSSPINKKFRYDGEKWFNSQLQEEGE